MVVVGRRSPRRGRRSSHLVLALAGILSAAAAAASSPTDAAAAPAGVEARPGILLGVLGSRSRFAATTGSRVEVGHAILGWSQGLSWGAPLDRLLSSFGPVPMLGLNTVRGSVEAITPGRIARGEGDAYLVALNRAIARWGRLAYVRPFAEMNAHWNAYSAYDREGRSRDRDHATSAFRRAFARVYLVLHGGPEVDRALAALGQPGIRRALASNPPERLRVIWNPQGFGNPDTAGNAAAAYYPGDRFVDVVGNDLYNIGGKAAWEANERLYRAHPGKPFAIPEWSNWGIDDPAFVRRMASFVLGHPRVELLAYYNGARGSTWDIATKPRTLAAYRSAVAPLAGG